MKGSVLIVGNFLSSSNGTRYICEELASHLKTSGWRVLTTSNFQNRIFRFFDMVKTAWSNRKNFQVAQVDVYSGRAFFWAEAVCKILRWTHKPFILTLHGGNLPAFGVRWPERVRRLLNAATVVTAPSPYLLHSMRRYRSDLTVIPNPLDLSSYEFKLRSRPEPKLVWLRSLHEIYNPLLAVKVVSSLAEEFPDIKLTMIGPDKRDGSLQAIRELIDACGLCDRVVLQGAIPKDNVPSCINNGDIFLNTTQVDNTPVSILEAMASGLCIVSTRVGGIPYLLQHERDGLLVPPDDPEAMANAVRTILKTDGLAERLSRNGRRIAESFDWSKVLPQWESLLTAIISG